MYASSGLHGGSPNGGGYDRGSGLLATSGSGLGVPAAFRVVDQSEVVVVSSDHGQVVALVDRDESGLLGLEERRPMVHPPRFEMMPASAGRESTRRAYVTRELWCSAVRAPC
jgi:hypothetical protein